MVNAKETLKRLTKSAMNIHRPDGSPNVFVFARPRGGSTWLMELILSQPGFKPIDEPLNLKQKRIRDHSGIHHWETLFSKQASAALQTYFGDICRGKTHFKDTNFRHNKHYRYLTHRIVFKVIHGGQDRINWFRDTFNGRVVLLLRHPIATSLSREELWTLETFMTSDYRQHFSDKQLAFAEKVMRSGSALEHRMLSWCFETALPLKQATSDWVIVSYEQLVLEPAPVLKVLADKLELSAPHLMEKQLYVASNSASKSDETTQQMLSSAEKREHLIKKWQARVTQDEEQRAMEILDAFELDTYTAGNALPHQRFWIQ